MKKEIEQLILKEFDRNFKEIKTGDLATSIPTIFSQLYDYERVKKFIIVVGDFLLKKSKKIKKL